MNRIIVSCVLFVAVTAGLTISAETTTTTSIKAMGMSQDVAYYVVPINKGDKAVDASDPAKVKIFPMLKANLAKKILFFLEPMERKTTSYTPKKDSMGMDYLQVKVDESTKKVLFYVNPMNKKMTSPKAMKDSMGMDYIPVYQMVVTTQE